jgi:hypothetical protein
MLCSLNARLKTKKWCETYDVDSSRWITAALSFVHLSTNLQFIQMIEFNVRIRTCILLLGLLSCHLDERTQVCRLEICSYLSLSLWPHWRYTYRTHRAFGCGARRLLFSNYNNKKWWGYHHILIHIISIA